MNSKRRVLLNSAIVFLEKAAEIVSQATDQEQDCLDNMPDNLQESDKYSDMEETIDMLESVSDKIDEAISDIKDSIE